MLWLQLEAASLLLAQGDPAAALPLCQHVSEASAGRPDRIAQRGQATRLVCLCAQNLSDPSLAQETAVGALGDIERYGDDRDFATYLDTMSMWFGLVGYRRLATLVRRAAIASHASRDTSEVAPLLNLAAVVVHDDPGEALQIASDALTRGERVGFSPVAALGHYAAAASALGRWSEAVERIQAQRAEGITSLRDWETYLAAVSATLAWGRDDAQILCAVPEAEMSATDGVVAGWWLMHAAVTTAFAGDLHEGAATAARAVERMADASLANEDLPIAYALAADMLIAGGHDVPARGDHDEARGSTEGPAVPAAARHVAARPGVARR